MAIPYVYPSGFDTFVPQATGQVIAYIRDPASYKINKYAQLIRTPKTVFVWYKMHTDDMGQRVVASALWEWVDGAKRPENPQNSQRFTLVEAQTRRHSYDFVIGWLALEQADLKLLVSHTIMARNQQMTNLTQRAATVLDSAAGWGSNVGTVNALNGNFGYWDQAVGSDPTSPYYLAIKKSLDAVQTQILLATNNAVNFEENPLKLVLSPNAALRMSQTDEIHNYIRESPFALAQLEGRAKGQNAKYGLPDQLYGWEIEIEASTIVTELAQASGGLASTTVGSPPPRHFIKSDSTAWVLTRIGGIDGEMGPSFTTLQIYYHDKEASVEVEDVPWDRLTKGAVSDNNIPVLAAPESGFLIQNLFST
jgi:hypothetical protein